eukprot:9253874-Heterocapsa_arctica.AAC.1
MIPRLSVASGFVVFPAMATIGRSAAVISRTSSSPWRPNSFCSACTRASAFPPPAAMRRRRLVGQRPDTG